MRNGRSRGSPTRASISVRSKGVGLAFVEEADEGSSGPASFLIVDPDGNPILVGQHVGRRRRTAGRHGSRALLPAPVRSPLRGIHAAGIGAGSYHNLDHLDGAELVRRDHGIAVSVGPIVCEAADDSLGKEAVLDLVGPQPDRLDLIRQPCDKVLPICAELDAQYAAQVGPEAPDPLSVRRTKIDVVGDPSRLGAGSEVDRIRADA